MYLSVCHFYSLAVQIESFKHLSIPRALLVDFVSEQCFNLPTEKKCLHKHRFGLQLCLICCFMACLYNRLWIVLTHWYFCFLSRCFQGFTKASALHQALWKLKRKDTEMEVFSERKKRIPVRLYKHCLKLQRKDDIMVQPKWLKTELFCSNIVKNFTFY